MDLQAEQQELQKTYRLHLNAVKNRHGLADKQIALMMGMPGSSADLARKMRAGDAKIQACRMIQLSRNLIQEYKDASVLQELVPEGFMAYAVKGGKVNGRVDDEINNITLYSGKILELVRGVDDIGPIEVDAIKKYAERIAAETGTIKEEVTV